MSPPQQLLVLLLATVAAAGHSSYNSVYNEVIPPELKQAIDQELPKEAKFFDELDCEYFGWSRPSLLASSQIEFVA